MGALLGHASPLLRFAEPGLKRLGLGPCLLQRALEILDAVDQVSGGGLRVGGPLARVARLGFGAAELTRG